MKRAMIIGLNYTGQPYALPDCEMDAQAMREMLESNGVDCQVSTGQCSAEWLIAHLTTVEATRQKKSDTLYLYFSGHGTQIYSGTDPFEADRYDEAICLYKKGVGIQVLKDHDLRAALDKIPGTKIVILDSCFSGGMAREVRKPGKARKFVQYDAGSMEVYKSETPKTITPKSPLYYMFACAEQEVSYSTGIGGAFTLALKRERVDGMRSLSRIMRAARVECEPDQTPVYLIFNDSAAKRIL